MNLRTYAGNKQCLIRLDGCNVEPTCLAHYRMIGLHNGTGIKNMDIFGAWACDSCHKKVDVTERGNEQTQFYFLQGVLRTQYQLAKEDILKW